jgi:DNA polymerase-3 subunit alpha
VKGDAMAFVTLEDLTGQAEVIVFPKVYQRCRDKLYEDNKLVISGRISEEEGKDAKLIADNMDEMDSFPRTLWLQFADDVQREKLMPGIRPLLEGSDGSDSVRTYVAETKIASEIDGISGVNADQTLIGRLTDILGEDNVRITFQPIHRRKQFWN